MYWWHIQVDPTFHKCFLYNILTCRFSFTTIIMLFVSPPKLRKKIGVFRRRIELKLEILNSNNNSINQSYNKHEFISISLTKL